MIKISHFTEAHQLYRSGVTPYRLLQEQAAVLLSIFGGTDMTVDKPYEVNECDIHWLLEQESASMNYAEYLGGDVYVCENQVDLLQIQGCDFEWAEVHNGKWPNVTDMPLSWDCCDYLQESSGEPEWVMFLMCWNNAGGNVYYVPKHLWSMARVSEHISSSAITSN